MNAENLVGNEQDTPMEINSHVDANVILNNNSAGIGFASSSEAAVITVGPDIAASLANDQNAVREIENSPVVTEHNANETSTFAPEILDFPISIIPGTESPFADNGVNQDSYHMRKNDLEKLMRGKDFYSTITENVTVSKADVILMILRFALENYASFSSVCHLFEMVNNFFEKPIFPESRHMLDKYFNDNIKVEFHAICHECNKYLGTMESVQKLGQCPSCGEKLDLSNPSSVNYFVAIFPSEFIKGSLQEFEDHYYHVVRERTKEVGHYKDIYDGQCYRQFVNRLSPEDRKQYATVIFNTNGAPKFESSNYSIWPIYIMLNEIPMEHRRPLLCGLWFGKHKPHMVPFLKPFVQAMSNLSSEGIPCCVKNENLLVKEYAICSCVDSVARAPMQGVKQFNGYYGCNWCLQEGTWEANYVRYPYLKPPAPLRDEKTHLHHMEEALRTRKAQYGVLGATALVTMPGFNIIDGLVAEYMHHFASGVGAQFAEYFEECMTKEDIAAVDRILLDIKVPNQIARLTRPFSDRGQWKAREWENWILYYSLPILREIKSVPSSKIKHWSLLVESLHILLSHDVEISELRRADTMLNQFVAQARGLDGKRAMTYNVHQLLHIAKSVLDWGPLWAHSAFAFEAGNKETLKTIKSAKRVTQQIVRFVNLQFAIQQLEREIYLTTSDVVKDFCENLKQKKSLKVLKLEHATYFGNDVVIDNGIIEQFQLSLQYTRAYLKIVKNHCLFMTNIKENNRSCNYYAQLKNGYFIEIKQFIVVSYPQNEFTICCKLDTRLSTYCKPLHSIIRISDELVKVETKDIATICVIVHVNKHNYICRVPNPYHYYKELKTIHKSV